MIPYIEKLNNEYYLEDGDCRSVKILNSYELKQYIEELNHCLSVALKVLEELEERENN